MTFRTSCLVGCLLLAGAAPLLNAQTFYAASSTDAAVNEFNASGSVIGSVSTGSGTAGVAVDSSGNVFVANQNAGSVTEYYVSGGSRIVAAAGSMTGAVDLAFDASGNLFVAGYQGNEVWKITNPGSLSSSYSGFASVSAASGVAFDASGNVYVTDYDAGSVYEYTSGGTMVGSGPLISGVTSAFGIAISQSGNIYVASADNAEIEQFTSGGANLGSYSDGLLAHPTGLSIYNNELYTIDQTHGTIVALSLDLSSADVIAASTGNGWGLDVTASAVPEPTTTALLGGAAVLGLALIRRRRLAAA